jgi:hypothetical protein
LLLALKEGELRFVDGRQPQTFSGKPPAGSRTTASQDFTGAQD